MSRARRPGELLAQDTFYVGNFKGLGKVYMQAVVDAFCSYGFATLHTSKRPETAALILHNEVLPFYAERGIEVGAVLTDNGREFCGTDAHPFELYLALNDIEHRKTRVRRPQTNGFVERFHRTVLDEFFRVSHARYRLRPARRPAGQARRLADPLQPRAAAPRLSQHGQKARRSDQPSLDGCRT